VTSKYLEKDVNCILADSIRNILVTGVEIEQSLTEDPVIRKSIKFLKTKWPFSSSRRDLLYLLYRSKALCVANSCLVFDERVVIWATFKQRVLQQFLFSHPGINRMKTFSGRYTNWLEMDKDIELLLEVALNIKRMLEAHHVKNQYLGSQRRHRGVECMLIPIILSMTLPTWY
ncbi:unnamed protein product, partial [Hymenolepis diminuta]